MPHLYVASEFYQLVQHSVQQISKSLNSRGDFSFSRNGPLSPELLTTFLLFMVADGNRRGIRHLVHDFWDEAIRSGIPMPTEIPVSASAICQARQRLPESLFRLMLNAIADEVNSAESCQRWRGRLVYAVDGQRLNVGHWAELQEELGVAEGSHCPQVLMSTLVNVLTRTPIDYEVDSRLATGERDHLLRMLPSVEAGSLLILDRGYPSHEVFQECAAADIEFLVRVSSRGSFSAVEAFALSGQSECTITLEPPTGSDPDWRPLRVRAVRVEGGEGPNYFLTSLSVQDVSADDIGTLYQKRWEVEEYFKLFTSDYVGQRQFRSRTAQGIKQEIGALTLFIALSRLLAVAAEPLVTDSAKFVSQKGAVLTLAKHVVPLLLDSDPDRSIERILRALQRVALTLDRRRPGRHFDRRSFRPRLKWDSSGRVGG